MTRSKNLLNTFANGKTPTCAPANSTSLPPHCRLSKLRSGRVFPLSSKPRPKRRRKPSDVSGRRSLPGWPGTRNSATSTAASPSPETRRDRKRAKKWVSRSQSPVQPAMSAGKC
ncbi:hypothetical protein F4V91_21755 [Neorhizobium galegae]|uniref:Uncharacterized protein n=1 Tax=Neorhizobium galegae TaxID=399 RepID=A0A6A1TW05_NEOGA|nr:hypothetical protein F4V91_21755 [Neorhizobium galegae]